MSFPTVTLPGLEMLFIRIDFKHRHFTMSLFTIGSDDALLSIKLHMLFEIYMVFQIKFSLS